MDRSQIKRVLTRATIRFKSARFKSAWLKPLARRPRAFTTEERGAVTVDMVGLIAGALTLTLAVNAMIERGMESASNTIASDTGGLVGSALQGNFGGIGNPGNNRANGRAGENPNGGAGWGSGAQGMAN